MTALPVVDADTFAIERSGENERSDATGEKETAVQELWAVAKKRLFSPRHLLTWWSLRREFDLTFIRPSEVKLEVPRGLLPHCDACVDLCCTGPNAIVSLRLTDIARLIDAHLDGAITHARPERPPSSTWARYELDTSVFSSVFPVLARDATNTCTLLGEDRQCTAYPKWPLSCARYPYALDALRRRVFLASGCRSHRLINIDDAPHRVRDLVDGTVRAYNERIKDMVILRVAAKEVDDLGILQHLSPTKKLARAFAKQGVMRDFNSVNGSSTQPRLQ